MSDHGHGPDTDSAHGEHADWTDQLPKLVLEGELDLGWITEAIEWLNGLRDVPATQVVDVGAGPGVAAVLLAERLPEAQVTAFDGTQALLDHARERAVDHGVGDRFRVRRGHIGPAMGDLPPADLIWASRVIHHLSEPREGVRQLGQLLSDNGLLALVEGGLPSRVLPGGYGVGPVSLVSRLDAAVADWAASHWGMTAAATGGERDWPALMADAGLRHVATRTFVLDHPAPLDEQTRESVLRRFAQMHEHLADRLDPADAAALARLVDPDDPAGLANRPDLFLLSANTVHVATRRP